MYDLVKFTFYYKTFIFLLTHTKNESEGFAFHEVSEIHPGKF